MKKTILLGSALLVSAMSLNAGDLLTNTNQSVEYLRMTARGASCESDAPYYNPAGTAFTTEGFQINLSLQNACQKRDITSTFALYPEGTRKFEGTAEAPVIPSIMATYKKGNWAASAYIGLVGGGGKANYKHGIPLFTSSIMAGLYAKTHGQLTPAMYDIESSVFGRQYIFGGQLGAAYKFNNHISAYAGVRFNYLNGLYKGHATAVMKNGGDPMVDLRLHCNQTGFGVAPILGLDYKVGNLTLGAKYEFRTNLTAKNDTKENTASNGALAAYADGVKTPNDMPAMVAVAAGYDFTSKLRATVEYHFFDDKNADMAGAKEKALKRGTSEALAGVEYDINRMFTVSVSGQRTDYGLSDGYQSDLSFACDSWSVGLGGAIHATPKLTVNLGYFLTIYSDYHKNVPAGNPGYNGTTMAGAETYARTNRVFGAGVTYKF